MKKLLLLTKTLLAAVLLCVGQNAWAGDVTVVKYSFDDSSSPSLSAGSLTSLDYSRTSVITSTKFLNAYNNGNGDPGAATLSLGSTDLSKETWTLEFEWAACGGCNSKADHTTLKAGSTTLFDISGNSNWNTTVTLSYGTSGSATLPVPGCDKAKRFTANVGDQYNITTYWHHFKITGSVAEGVKLTVTNSDSGTKVVDGVTLSETNVSPTSIIIEPCCGGAIALDELHLYYVSNVEAVSVPSIGVAYAGANRTVTITPGVSSESNPVTTYYTIDGSDPTSSSAVYSSPLDIAADCTVKAISISSTDVASAIVSQELTVGKLKLVAPTFTKTGYAAGKYTISMASNQSGLAYPPASYTNYYSIDGGDAVAYSAAFELNEGSTVTGYVAATNYTNSDEVNLTSAARPTYYATEWTQDYRNLTSAAGTGAQSIGLSDVVFSVDGTDFKNIVSYGSPATELNLNTNVGLNTNDGVNLRTYGANSGILVNNTNTAKIGIQNLKVGDYIVLYVTGIVPTASYGCTLQEGMSTWSEYYFRATETSASINIPKGTYNYIYTITVLSATVSATIGSNGFTTFASPYPLDLTSATQDANGFTAYRASAVNDETVTFKDDVDQSVVANTGVLLQGTANAVVTIPVVASGSALAENALQVNVAGTTFDAAANTTYYGMNKDSNPLTFGTFNPSTVAIPASKAYLALTSKAARSIRVVFGDITGVANVEAAAEVKANEGKFIENGKLVIVKNGQKFNAAGQQVK